MSQRKTVVGTRSSLLWLLILIAVLLLAGIVVVALVILPQLQAARTEQARLAEVERHYQAGVAFQNVDDWVSAEGEFKQVVALNAGYKDVQARLTEVRARGLQATATVVAALMTGTAEARIAGTITVQAALTSTADALEARYQKGIGYINMKRWAEAQGELEQVFAASPNYKDVQVRLSEIAIQLTSPTPLMATATSSLRPITATPTSTPVPAPTRTPRQESRSYASTIGDPVGKSPNGPFDLAATAPQEPSDLWPSIPGAVYIWYRDYQATPLYFVKTIEIPPSATGIRGTIQITADNYFNLWVNGVDYGGTSAPDTWQWQEIKTFDLPDLHGGSNTVLIRATEATPGTLPSMLIYKLTVTYLVP